MNNKKKTKKKPSERQAIIFQKYIYTTKKAESWLKNNNYKPINKVKTTATELTYTINNMKKYKRFYRTKPSRGIVFIIGFKDKKPEPKPKPQQNS